MWRVRWDWSAVTCTRSASNWESICSLYVVRNKHSDRSNRLRHPFTVSVGLGSSTVKVALTGDITKIAAQVPALFEALSGMQMSELLSKVRLIGDNAPKPAPPTLPNQSS